MEKPEVEDRRCRSGLEEVLQIFEDVHFLVEKELPILMLLLRIFLQNLEEKHLG